MAKIKPIRITRDGEVTTVIWSDDTETTVKRMQDDKDDIYNAFTAALAKKYYRCNGEVKRLIDEAESADPEPLKKGDEVEILDGSKIPNFAGGWIESMNEYIGDFDRVWIVGAGGTVLLEHNACIWDSRGLKKIRKKG